MSNIRLLAPLSLLGATLLFLATLPFTDSFWGGLVNAFAEAGMIGGLADWFAVVALFRHPFGIPIPHTAIIPLYRSKLTAGIVDIVQNTWLRKETILERIGSRHFMRSLLSSLDAENRAALLQAMRALLHEILRALDPERTAAAALTTAYERISPEDGLRLLRKTAQLGLREGWHITLLEEAMRRADDWLSAERVRAMISENLRKASEDYSARTPLRKLGRWMAEKSNVLNYDDLAASITAALRGDIADVLSRADHPLRGEVAAWLEGRVRTLDTDPAVLRWYAEFRESFFTSEAVVTGVAEFFDRLRERLLEDLAREDSVSIRHIDALISDGITRLQQSDEAVESAERWIKERIASLVEQHHDEIGRLVRHNVDKLDDRQLVSLIENKVGSDLQYIRLNGAIVGGLVGALLYVLKTALN